MASPETIARAFILMRANWPTYEYGKHTIPTYERCLVDIPDEVLEAAVVECLSTCTFFPKIAEIRKAAVDLVTRENDRLSAEEAWGLVSEYVTATHYIQQRMNLSDEVRAAVKAMGGWRVFQLDQGGYAANRARFCDAYKTIAERKRKRAEMLPEVRAVLQLEAE